MDTRLVLAMEVNTQTLISHYQYREPVSQAWVEKDGVWRFNDKYGLRMVQPLEHRVVAFIFNHDNFCFTENIVYWYRDFNTPEDAINAAKNWALRRLEFEQDRTKYWLPVNYPGYLLPDCEVEKQAW